MTITRRGFTLANGLEGYGQPDEQTTQLVDVVNRLLRVFGQQGLPSDTDESNLADRLDGMVRYVEKFKSSASNVAMRNRLKGASNRPVANQPLTDAEVAARLRARGIDPKDMPRSGR